MERAKKNINPQRNNWLGVHNNPTVPAKEYLECFFEHSKARYVTGQLERGKEGTLHIQFFVNFKGSGQRMSALKKLDPRAHWTPVVVNNGADVYCMKEDTKVDGPWSFGERPHKMNDQVDWDLVWKNSKKGNFEAIDKQILVTHYSNISKIRKDYMKAKPVEHLRGVWIWGEAGIGKSWKARTDYPDYYPKLCNKWWDGYQGQRNVIMDDIGPEHKVLGQQLKIWSDRHDCILEVKGGAVTADYEWFVVTSQYPIESIWEDAETRAALRRRFKVIHMVDPFKPSEPVKAPLNEGFCGSGFQGFGDQPALALSTDSPPEVMSQPNQ